MERYQNYKNFSFSVKFTPVKFHEISLRQYLFTKVIIIVLFFSKDEIELRLGSSEFFHGGRWS